MELTDTEIYTTGITLPRVRDEVLEAEIVLDDVLDAEEIG